MSENPSPRMMLSAAASGDTKAQSGLACWALDLGAQGVVSELEALSLAEAYSRLAAAKGDAMELCLLAGVLFYRARHAGMTGDLQTAREYMVEGIYQANRAGDAGHEQATTLLLNVAADLPADVVADAAKYCPEEDR